MLSGIRIKELLKLVNKNPTLLKGLSIPGKLSSKGSMLVLLYNFPTTLRGSALGLRCALPHFKVIWDKNVWLISCAYSCLSPEGGVFL